MIRRKLYEVSRYIRDQFTRERMRARAVRFKQGLRIAWRIFNEKGVLSHASVCSYSTMLSLVPILAFSLVILNMFTSTSITDVQGKEITQEEVSNKVFDFFFNHFVPGVDADGTGQLNSEIADTKKELISIIRRAASLRFLILVFLIITCVSLFNSIEYAYNEIWAVRTRRSLFAQFLAFWILITMTPILLGFSMYYTSQLTATETFNKYISQDSQIKIFWHALSYFFTLTAFMIANRFLPNCRVYFMPALIASAISAFLFEVAKSLFDSYVTYAIKQPEGYYSVFRLATIPIFILWLYYCFTCFLIGPVIATTIQDFEHHLSRLRPYSWKFYPRPIQSIYLFILICRYFRIHKSGIATERLEDDTGIVFDQLRRSLRNLEQVHLIHMDRQGLYYPNADPETTTLSDVLHRILGLRPEKEDSLDPQFNLVNDAIYTILNGKHNIPISSLIHDQTRLNALLGDPARMIR